MATEERRARYWARSFAGWHEFAAVQPNRAHFALAQMQRMGWAQDIITQNVDRLHHKAASRDIIELHGTTHRCASWQHYSAGVINTCEADKCQLLQRDSLLHSLELTQTSSIMAEACLHLCIG
jgi:NAD-dependent SIR2 family protein deacetylase